VIRLLRGIGRLLWACALIVGAVLLGFGMIAGAVALLSWLGVP